MQYPVIEKPREHPVPPNLADYDATAESFQWADVERELDWLPGGGLNLAHEAIDRHCDAGRGSKLAMLWEGKNGEEERYTFEDMRRESNKFANVLKALGVQKGERVFIFAERLPELYFAVFGTLKAGCIIGPLFSAFGPDPVRDRLENSGASVLITQPDLRQRIAPILTQLPALKHTVIINKSNRSTEPLTSGDLDYYQLMDAASEELGPLETTRDDYSVMHYTSGTTGKPKGAVHRHNAVVQHYLTGKWVLDLHPDDVYWCTADPGWVTGTSYGMFAPWTNGVTQVIYEGGLRASKWYEIIQKYRVSVWYTAPTAVRMLMKAGADVPRRYDLSSLRYTCSVGEPLNPEAIFWGQQALDMPIHDNWWQTETGAILIANYPVLPIRPGSMGKPLPGIAAGVVDDKGNEVGPGEEGDLAIPARLARHVPDLLAGPGAVRLQVRQRLVHHRRPRPPRRRRLFLVRGPRRRRDQHGRPPGGPLRGGERAHRAPRRGRGWGHRQTGPHRHGGGQGFRIAQRRPRAHRQAAPGDYAFRPGEAGGGGRAPGDRLHRLAAQDAQRQDHAPPAEGPRAGPARGRHEHPGR